VAEVNTSSPGWGVVYWICQIGGWGAYVALGLSMVLPQAGPQPFIIGGYALFFVYSIALTHLLRRTIRKREWLALPLGRAGARLLAAAVIVGTVQALLIVVVQSIWTKTPPSAESGSFFVWMWGNTTAATLVWTALYAGAAALVRGRRLRQDAIALELDMREARLKALEAQIGPHFLFNCLNSLRGLILENPVQAQDMVTRLAKILRHNLARDSNPSEPLGAQIEFTTDYLALESIRFEERLRTRFDIEPATQTAAIPAMLLQTLVENALKHGISHLPGGGDVIVRSHFSSDTLVITVENTGRLMESPAGSTRFGLANLRERLRVLHGSRASLDLSETTENSVRATVRIPRDELTR
jgi:two-component sensor histidine kinase